MTSTAPPRRRIATTPAGPSRRPNPRVRIPLLVVGVVALLVAALWVVDSLVHRGEILTGVDVAGVDVAGLGDDEAQEAVARAAEERTTASLAWKVEETTGEVTPSSIGVSVDVPASTRAALAVGRTGNPLRRLHEWVRARTVGVEVPMQVDTDDTAFRAWLASLTFARKAAPVEPVVDFEGTKPVLTPGVPGIAVDADTATERVVTATVGEPDGTVSLRTVEVPPRYTDTQALDVARETASSLLAAPVEVTLASARTTLTPEELGSILRSSPEDSAYRFVVDREATLALLRPRFASVGTPPVDAEFAVTGNTVQIVRGRVGVGCCGAGTEDLLRTAMEESDPAGRVAALPQGEVPPDVTSEDLTALHVSQKLAEFTTNHAPDQPRVVNIHKIADLVQGTVVMPGEQYSINRTIGRRTEEDGWVMAPTIVEGEMTATPGGGISQFATTMYNALYFSGIQIDEHKPHTKYIDRYPKGREATLGYPSPDLVFTNDMPSAVLVWTAYNDTSITVSIWGTSDGRKAAASEPEVRSEGECEIVKVTRTVTYGDGRTKQEPYTQKYCP